MSYIVTVYLFCCFRICSIVSSLVCTYTHTPPHHTTQQIHYTHTNAVQIDLFSKVNKNRHGSVETISDICLGLGLSRVEFTFYLSVTIELKVWLKNCYQSGGGHTGIFNVQILVCLFQSHYCPMARQLGFEPARLLRVVVKRKMLFLHVCYELW